MRCGQRNAGRSRAAQRRGDARHDRDRQAGGAQRLDLLAAAAEDERIARLQAHHGLAGAHAADQLGVDRRPASSSRWPLRLPTATSSASRRARARTAGGTRSSCRMASASLQELRGLAASADRDRPGRRRRYGRCRTGASRRRAASSSLKAARRAPASSPASASRAAGPSTSRRQKARRRAGSTISALTWARKVAASRARAPMRSGSTASMRPRRMVGQRRRGAAGRDRHHDVVAVDDGRQDEIAERRPVGDVDRHAGRLGGALGLGVGVEIAGGDEDGGGAAQVVGADVGGS